MRFRHHFAAITFLLAFLVPLAAAQDQPTGTLAFTCVDGKPVIVTIIAVHPGVYQVPLPPDVCIRNQAPPPKPAVQPPNDAPRRTT
ncbi:MAG: hypothetical protein K0R58_224 [Ramlibacter sp.]|jgi:hypothetical protein|nr:hypothetical protein [Ramlibacter sp.]